MTYQFYKYQGTGNDFIVIDNRNFAFDRKDTALVARMCDRKFGIGAERAAGPARDGSAQQDCPLLVNVPQVNVTEPRNWHIHQVRSGAAKHHKLPIRCQKWPGSGRPTSLVH